MKDFRHLEGVTTLRFDHEKCIGCGNCAEVCPHGVLVLKRDQRAKKARLEDFEACMECGACMINCPVDAIEVSPGVGCAAYIISVWMRDLGLRKKPGCC